MIITIDGPTASGKSTVARKVAEELELYYFNSGFLYRSLAYIFLYHYKYRYDQLPHIDIVQVHHIFNEKQCVYIFDAHKGAQVFFQEHNITSYLKSPLIDQAASLISAHRNVREYLIPIQRSIAYGKNLVADGRDMGSVIFPYAELKLYLTASLSVRIERWRMEQQQKGYDVSYIEAEKQLQERDERDQSRDIAPLIIPDSAIVIETSVMSVNDIVRYIVSHQIS